MDNSSQMDNFEINNLPVEQLEVDETAFERSDLQRLRLFLYFIPVFGAVPAFWTLLGQPSLKPTKPRFRETSQGGYPSIQRRERQVSRLSVQLTLGWLVTIVLVSGGGAIADLPPVSLLILKSLVSSGYVLTNVWLMVQLWRRQRLE